MTKDLLTDTNSKAKSTPFGKWDREYIKIFKKDISEFRRLIEDRPTESKIQRKLEENPIILVHAAMDGFFDGAASSRTSLFSKFQLGNEFETDFMFCYGTSMGISCTFVELERADVPLFTKKGDPSKYLTHALRQVMNWRAWLEDHRDFALSEIVRVANTSEQRWDWPATLRKPFRFVIVIGRRSKLTEHGNRLRAELCNSTPGLEIVTYDRLFDNYWFDKTENLEAEEHRTVREYSEQNAKCMYNNMKSTAGRSKRTDNNAVFRS